MIKSVAMSIGPLVISVRKPARHDDIYKQLHGRLEAIVDGSEELGFLDDNGNFLSRAEAYSHAVECGQILKGGTGILISEDVW